MKTNICKALDLKELDKAIDTFHSINSVSEYFYPYLIMSRDTCSKIAAATPTECQQRWPGTVYTYRGHKIAFDDGLSFGEIDIR